MSTNPNNKNKFLLELYIGNQSVRVTLNIENKPFTRNYVCTWVGFNNVIGFLPIR